MAATTAPSSRDPRTRYEGGFDRWSRESRRGWSVLCHDSEHTPFAMADGHTIWAWDASGRIWNRVAPFESSAILREHENAMRRLRRALLVVKLIDSKVEGERTAAYSALERIGSAIVATWQNGRTALGLPSNAAWFDHPAAIYLAVTQDCRFHLAERERMPFDPGVFAGLVATAQEDFKAGRRPQPPRLRPDDLVYLQATVGSSEHAAGVYPPGDDLEPDDLDAADELEPELQAADHPDADRIAELREALAQAVTREIDMEASHQRLRRRCLMVSGSLAVGLALIVAILRTY